MPHLGRVALFVMLTVSLGTAAPSTGFGMSMEFERPPPSNACRAWREHISDLIDQHRTAHDIDDDALLDFVLQFNASLPAMPASSAALNSG
jgi:hypothetical protein